MHEITIRVSVTPGRVRLALLFLLLVGFPKLSATQDEPQLWSYFPPPTAVFNTVSAGNGAAAANPLELARDYGNVTIGNPGGPNTNLNVLVKGSATTTGNGRPYRLAVRGALRINGCIFLKNGAMGSTWNGTTWSQGGAIQGTMDWRCTYFP